MEHIQLTFRNWNSVCDFTHDFFIEGTYLDKNGNQIASYTNHFDNIGLFLKIDNEKVLVKQDEYIIKENGKLKILSELQFERNQKLEQIGL